MVLHIEIKFYCGLKRATDKFNSTEIENIFISCRVLLRVYDVVYVCMYDGENNVVKETGSGSSLS